jgi:hypothetical protein
MLSIVRSIGMLAALVAWANVSVAADAPPRILQEPVFGLRMEAANPRIEALPDDLRNKCFELADSEFLTSRQWIYAAAVDSRTSYYVVAGYFKRRKAEANQAQYRLDTFGGVYRIEGSECMGLGAAREVFDVRALDEIPQPVLQQLADDLASRLVRAFGGPEKLGNAWRRQKVDQLHLPLELQRAFQPYLHGP